MISPLRADVQATWAARCCQTVAVPRVAAAVPRIGCPLARVTRRGSVAARAAPDGWG